MGTTSEKLTYLNTTKGKIKDSINLTGANIGANDTFRSYASKLKLGLIDIINNGTDNLYSNFPKVSGKGSNLSLTPTYEAPMENIVYGDTLQDGTPTPDAPVEIQSVTGLQNINVCGKNLLNLGTKSITTYYQESNLNIPAGTYTLSSKITSDDTQYTQSRAYFYNGNTQVGMFTLNRNTRSSATITLNNLADRIIIYSSIDYSSSNGKNATWEDIQLEKGSTSTDYEPYKGNTYEVNLGKNLISSILKTGNNIFFNGTSTTNEYVFKAGTYTFNYVDSTIRSTYINYSDGTQTNLGSGKPITFTSNLDFNLRIYGSGITVEEVSNVQLEKGTQATSYSPYFTPIELNKIGNYQDRIYKDNGKWYVEKQIGKVNLEDYEYNKYGASAGYSRNTTTQIPNIKYVSVNTELGKGLCEKYQIHTGSGMSGNDAENHFAIDVSMFQVSIPNNDTPSGLFYYALATPTYIEITNTELINQLESIKSKTGTTNISTSSEYLPAILGCSALKNEE